MMADEEAKHIEILSEQFKEYHARGEFLPRSYDDKHASSLDSKILNKEMMGQISAAGFEAAAISAAVTMEQRAVKLYSQRAEATTNPPTSWRLCSAAIRPTCA